MYSSKKNKKTNKAALIRRKSYIKDVNIAGVPDAGLFLDFPSIDGQRRLRTFTGFEEIVPLQEITSDYAPCVSLYAPYNQVKQIQ